NVVLSSSSRVSRINSPTPPFLSLPKVSIASDTCISPKFYLAGVPGLEPGPKVLETSMLTIDTIPLKFSNEYKVRSRKQDFPALTSPLCTHTFTCFLYAAGGSGNGGKIY